MVLTKLLQEKRYKDKIWKFLDKTVSNKNMFCIKKRNGKECCLKAFQGRDLEMINVCKHCLVIVITINYKSSLPFPQNGYGKREVGKLFYNPHCSLLLGTLSINSSAKLVVIFFFFPVLF